MAMSKLYRGIFGNTYELSDNCLAKGGEGEIREISGYPIHVAKVFFENKRTKDCEEKLINMHENKITFEQMGQVAWPLDVIYDENGFCGYIMRKALKSISFRDVLNQGEFDLRHRILVGINLCIAIQNMHDLGYMCGDLNPENICVELDPERKFNVLLVDVDSYHLTFNNKVFRCNVGVQEYIAPELQGEFAGVGLSNATLPTYTKETDLFTLALHLFSLLMNGAHAFSCACKDEINSVDCPQPDDNIKNGFYPFYQKNDIFKQPVFTPDFDSLPFDIQKLFIRAFVDGFKNPELRPIAEEWEEVLLKNCNELTICNNKKHYYFACNTECPYCEVEKRLSNLLDKENKQENDYSEEKKIKDKFSYYNTNTGEHNVYGAYRIK
jgi:DNA-binding helix-hairpin-helix protein with protein kinase domain